jgi:hypothetical protein
VDGEIALAGAVRDWAQGQCPHDPSVAEGAVAVALSSFAAGALVSEACERARAFVASRICHPAGIRGQGRAGDRLAS